MNIQPLHNKRYIRWTLLIITLLGLYLRCLNFPLVFGSHGIEYFGSDPYYHVLRTTEIVHNFPHIANIDTNLHYPKGAVILYPGGFHFLSALLVKITSFVVNLFTSDFDQEFLIKCVCALMPLGFFIFNLGLLYRIGRQCVSRNDHLAPLLIATLYSIMPESIDLTSVGNYDHHPLESAFALISLLLLAKLTRTQNYKKVWLAGVIFGLMLWFWVQSLIFALSILVIGLIYQKRSFVDCMISTTLTTALLVSFFGAWNSVELNQLSAAQPLVLFGAVIILVFVWLMQRRQLFSWQKTLSWGVWLALLIAQLLFLYQHAGKLFDDFNKTFFATNPFIHLILESAPLNWRDLGGIGKSNGLIFFFLPFFLLWHLYKIRKNNPNKPENIYVYFVAGFYFFGLFLFFRQIRFVTFLLPFYAILNGLLATITIKQLQRRRPQFIAIAIAMILIFPFSLLNISPYATSTSNPIFAAVRDAAQFLRAYTIQHPPPESAKGVLAQWDTGHWVRYYSGLPSVTSPMTASQEASEWNAAASKVFFMNDFEKARERLSQLKVAYIFATLPSLTTQKLADDLNSDITFFKKDPDGSFSYTKEAFDSLIGRITMGSPAQLPHWLTIIYRSHQTVAVDRYMLPMLVVAKISNQ